VIHRDIKPENILLQDNHAMVLDFGIAGAVSTHGAPLERASSGTPGYMSPEQMLGEPVDGRADVYSLARTFAEMVTGALPEGVFDGKGRIPRDIVAVIRRALEPDPNRRYPTAGEFAEDLSPCQPEVGWWEKVISRFAR